MEGKREERGLNAAQGGKPKKPMQPKEGKVGGLHFTLLPLFLLLLLLVVGNTPGQIVEEEEEEEEGEEEGLFPSSPPNAGRQKGDLTMYAHTSILKE